MLLRLNASALVWLFLAGIAPQGMSAANASSIQATLAVDHFYELRNGALAWTGPANTRAYQDLTDAIQSAELNGLDPADYHLAELAAGDSAVGNRQLDRIATDAYLTLAAHLLSGRLDPVTIEPDWTASKRERDLAVYLESALGNNAVAESLDALAPTQREYSDLRHALAYYRGIAERGGWPSVSDGGTLRVGDRGDRIVQLRERLAATGDLPRETDEPALFDETLAEAVRHFQRRANLEPDGIVGVDTLAQLNKSVDSRIAQIRANMERWRWLPDDLGRRHIRVNIADFRLEAHADGKVEQIHKVIVGRLYRKTPVFSGNMSYLVFNPWWETPPSLAAKDKLPAFRKNPESVEALGFQIIDANGELIDPKTIDWNRVPATRFPYRIRQAPGAQNALGHVKFMFPNRHNVYLHDTPTRELFGETRRDFSSGCVRVNDALDLAAWLLSETPDWGPERIQTVVANNSETRISLAYSVPVHILYLTVVSDQLGTVRFVNDVYGRDQRLFAALDH